MKYGLVIPNISISNAQQISMIIIIKCLISVFSHLNPKFNANLKTILFIHWLFSIMIEHLCFLIMIILTFTTNLYFVFNSLDFFE